MEKIKGKLYLIIYFVLAVFSVLPFFHTGFITMHDNTQVARVYEMGKSLSQGVFPVRIVQDLGYGFGYPIFNFYAPLTYYIGGFLDLLGFGSLIAAKIVFFFGIILSGASMYFLVKHYFGKIPALVSSIIYLYFPYHAVNVYVRGDLGETYAYAFLPLVFLGLSQMFNKTEKEKISLKLYPSVLLSSLSISFVVLSHNLTAFMLLIFLAPFILFNFVFHKEKIRFIKINAIIFVLVFLVTAFYTIPVVFEMKYTNVLSQVGGGANYSDHFVCPIQLWESQWGFGGSAKGCLDGLSFKLGKLNIILILFSFLVFIFSKKRKFSVAVSFLLFVFSIFMMTSFSSFVWAFPFMDFLQYPWRFLNFSGLFLSFLIGYLLFCLKDFLKDRGLLVLALFIIAISLFTNLKLFVPQTYEYQDYSDKKYLRWTVSKISDEYLPMDFEKPKIEKDVRVNSVDVIEGNGRVTVLEEKANKILAKLSLNVDSKVRINKAFFPGWMAYVNGEEKRFDVGKDGLFLNLNKGESVLELKYISTPIQKTGNMITLSGIVLLLIGIIAYSRK